MRRLVSLWSALATALVAGVIGDGSSEWLTDRGALGGSVRDTHQESLLPVALLAAIILVALVFHLLAQRVRANDPIFHRRPSLPSEVLGAFATLGMTFVTVVLMEGYETRFGGISPFDIHAVLVAHAFASILAYVLAVVAVRLLVRRSLCMALRAGFVLSNALSRFLRRLPATGPAHSIRRSLAVRATPYGRERAIYSNGFRAPPGAQTLALNS